METMDHKHGISLPQCPKCEALLAPLRAAVNARDWLAFQQAECALFDHFAPGTDYLPKAEGMLPPDVRRALRSLCGAMLSALTPYERAEGSGDAY